MVIFTALFFLGVRSQLTYYVASTGSDSSACGTQSSPCATINQVLTNYLGSYTVSIGAGTYATTAITLQDNPYVNFTGADSANPTITASWSSGSYITNSATSGFEFHNLQLTLSGFGDAFTTLNSAANYVGFYDIILTYSKYNGTFISMNGGSVAIENVSISNAFINGYFVIDESDNQDSNITITGSTFANISFGDNGGFLTFNAYGAANLLINGSSFSNINASYAFIGFWAADSHQAISITNNLFVNINTYLPSVYVENDYECVVYVSSTSWTNSTAGFVSGALETLGSDDGVDHNISLNNLTFTNCSGDYVGAILVGFNSLNVSGSRFAGNFGRKYGNDLVQGLDSYSSQFLFNITDSYSESDLPKAIILDISTGSARDISDWLPYPSGAAPVPIRHLTRANVSASPKFGRKPRKK